MELELEWYRSDFYLPSVTGAHGKTALIEAVILSPVLNRQHTVISDKDLTVVDQTIRWVSGWTVEGDFFSILPAVREQGL
jgi:hypothetical protein